MICLDNTCCDVSGCAVRSQVRFVTNTTKDTTANLVRLVQGLGFDIQEHEVGASPASAMLHAHQQKWSSSLE
jgi:hypothetical protein